jgi:hypothetical protein
MWDRSWTLAGTGDQQLNQKVLPALTVHQEKRTDTVAEPSGYGVVEFKPRELFCRERAYERDYYREGRYL